MVLVAGLDPRPAGDPDASGFLPSGRAAFFRLLVRRLLAAEPRGRVLVVAESEEAIRVPKEDRRRTTFRRPDDRGIYGPVIEDAAHLRPALLVIDRLEPGTLAPALAAAGAGRVAAQLDTVLRGAELVRSLAEMGAPQERLNGVRWAVAVHRCPALCPHCRRAIADPALLEMLRGRIGAYDRPLYESPGCPACGGTGRQGDISVFDIFYQDPDGRGEAVLPLERYLLGLAAGGHVDARDLLDVDGGQLRRTYRLLAASERSLHEANAALERKLVELEAAQRVLEQRNRALMSLEDMSRALLSPMKLRDLTAQVCRSARDLGGADRVILYCQCDPGVLDVLAAIGWDPERLPDCVEAAEVFDSGDAPSGVARLYNRWPPGIPYRSPDIEGVELRAGLLVPLVAQGEAVGAMFVHSTRRREFLPAEIAVLEAFAGQAALAVQRTRLIEQLEDKIAQLEAAQAGLAAKERLERELELAREVQQSMLPRTFPVLRGYAFAARNEPARRVGGDFYDAFLLEEGRFGVAVADVSDKGMAAALYMALSRSLLLAEARRERSPRRVLEEINRLLRDLGRPGMFVSIFYGIVDARERRMRYARAGHDRPVLLRDGQAHELGGRGSLLGIFDPDELHVTEEEIALAPGDRIAFYTDGLTDVMAPDGEAYGADRLHALLTAHAAAPIEPFCDAVFAALASHRAGAEQFDDMTLLVMDVARDETTDPR
jgi:serine phosphatase RsbU (regulator of sigma subunit)